MRRIFIIRKDLHLSPGKFAAMVGHAAELYWLNLIKDGGSYTNYGRDNNPTTQSFEFSVPYEVWTDYINGIYTKTICESRNLNHLLKAKAIADELGLKENEDYGFIKDKCLTELKPENDDGTTTVGVWFAPLDDEVAHKISKKFPLLKEHRDNKEYTTIATFRPLQQEWNITWHRIGHTETNHCKTIKPTLIDAVNDLLQNDAAGIPSNDVVIDYIDGKSI